MIQNWETLDMEYVPMLLQERIWRYEKDIKHQEYQVCRIAYFCAFLELLMKTQINFHDKDALTDIKDKIMAHCFIH